MFYFLEKNEEKNTDGIQPILKSKVPKGILERIYVVSEHNCTKRTQDNIAILKIFFLNGHTRFKKVKTMYIL